MYFTAGRYVRAVVKPSSSQITITITNNSNNIIIITMSHGSAYCCKGDTASQWEMTILGYQNSVTPEPID